MSLVLKNIGLGVESAYANPVAPSSYPRIRSANLDVNYNKKQVDDTAGTRKGFGRIVNLNREVNGDIGVYAYSDDLGWWLKGAFGAVTSFALASGYRHVFDQLATLTLPSYTIVADKGVKVTRWTGVRINSLQLSGAVDIIEGAVGVLASVEDEGSAYTPSGNQSLDPFTFDQVTIKIGNTLALASGATAMPMDAWEFNYSNEAEQRWQSGSPGASRVDAKIAMTRGSFTKFYETDEFEEARNDGTEKALLIEATGPAIGATNHKLIIRIPRVEFMTSVRPYEAGQLIVETAEWEAMYDQTYGYMVQAELTNLKTNYNS